MYARTSYPAVWNSYTNKVQASFSRVDSLSYLPGSSQHQRPSGHPGGQDSDRLQEPAYGTMKDSHVDTWCSDIVLNCGSSVENYLPSCLVIIDWAKIGMVG